jgi:hypothetical protein
MKHRFFLPTLVVGLFACASLSATGPLKVRQPSPETTAALPSEDRAGSPQDFPIPGPLRSFLRMAGISQQIPVADVLPSLSWNVSALGFQGSDRPTEFLVLLRRYVIQARELSDLAGGDGVIRISNCEEAKPLLRILGYRTLGQCGEEGTSLLTADAERAFLTVDSGFPLTDLEQTLSGGKPFEYPYPSTRVPVMFAENDWTTASSRNHIERSKDLLDTLLDDRSVSRLYWAVSKMDPQTAVYLRQNVGVRKLVAYGPLLDFYGTHLCIRNGHVLVPGGPSAERTWEDLVGASPATPADFIPRLLLKDKGWLVAYFDVLSIVNRKQQTEFTEPKRLHRFYDALRPPDRSSNAAKGVFRPSPWLLLLVSQVRWDENGQPTVPGGIDIWKEVLKKDSSRAMREKEKNYPSKNPEELLEAMFARARKETDTGTLQAYITLVDLDNKRPTGHRLSPETAHLMILKYADYSDQYRVFSEFPELSDASISLFLETAEGLAKVPNAVRANALGIMQANLGLWQILARQGQIADADLDDSWQNVVKPFGHIRSASELYDAGRSSLAQLSRAAVGKSAFSQDDMIELLAGPRQTTTEGKRIHREMADRIRSVLNGQRIVSLDTLNALGDGLKEKENGTAPPDYLFNMAGELHEFEMPQPMFTKGEREEWAARIYNNHHTDLQMRSNVGTILKSPKASRSQIEDARGQLTSFLRDTLVALNYAYYEPPGAQALHNNPLFVRSHDFAGETVEGIKSLWQAPQLFGVGYPAGGGAHLVGSLADLPYVLADLEQDFIAPKNTQALIWKELVPSLLTSAVLPRWWNVTSTEMHAVTLYQKAGEELLTASANDEELRNKVMAILSDRVLPRRSGEVEEAMRGGQVSDIISKMMPADTFYLAAEFERRYPNEEASRGSAGQELAKLRQHHPEEVSWQRLSQDFGVPHPTLGQTYGRELLNVPPLPAFSGYASRLLGESWDSSNLYWARLADESGRSPAELNVLVPELTERMVEKIFATDFEDWPAILRAMRETGEEFRQSKVALLTETPGQ